MLRYAITDRRWLAPDQTAVDITGAPFMRDREDAHGWVGSLAAQAARLAARGDIDFLQLREKDLAPAALATLAREILATLRAHAPDPTRAPKLLINSRADVALAVRADGVHLTSSPGELTTTQVRALYAAAGFPAPVISLSCHTLAEVFAARSANPSLILFGPVSEKRIADELISQGSGLDLLRAVCIAAAPIPVLALGGITDENTSACIAAGAAGIAAIRLFSR